MEEQRFIKKFVNLSVFSRVTRDMQVAIREMYYPVIYLLLLPLTIGLMLTIVGPFGTFSELNFGQRLAYWVSITWINWLQLGLFLILLREVIPNINFALLTGMALVLASLPASLEVIGLEFWMRPEKPLKPWIQMYAYVLILSTCVYTPVIWISPRLMQRHRRKQERSGNDAKELKKTTAGPMPDSTPTPTPASATTTPSPCIDNPIIEQLPINLRGEIYCLKSEDHYLKVYTEKGEGLILYRIKDAVEQLKDCTGARVHRSYWVNINAVTRRSKFQGKQLLILKNGLRVPVSRSFHEELNKLFGSSDI